MHLSRIPSPTRPAERLKTGRLAGLLLAATCGLLFGPARAPAQQPNIILILADDMGWNGSSAQMDPDIAESKSDFYQTPNLEALAAEGMRFSDAYASPVCSPTRAAVQTGKSPAQLQMTDVTAGGDPASSRYLSFYANRGTTPPIVREFLPGEEETIAERIGALAPTYTTGLFGKWHLTYNGGPIPIEQGYDESTAGLNPNLTVDENPKHIFSLSDRAVRFMEDRVAETSPFFVSIQHYAPHLPWQAQPDTIAKYESLPPGFRHRNALYAAMTEDMDAGIGRVLDAIDSLGIQDNTYVIFTSDNGPVGTQRATESLPLHDFKGTTYEGGVRVPMIITGPGIEAGSFSDVPVTLQDLFATVSEMAGINAPLGPDVESASLLPILHNGGELPEGVTSLQRTHGPNGELYFHSPHYFGATPLGDRTPTSAIRDGDYKLIKTYGQYGQPDQLALFNIGANVAESNDPASPLNLADALPETTALLHAKLQQWLQDVDASLPYQVSSHIELVWEAEAPGADPTAWRSTVNVDNYFRERWERSAGAGPTPQSIAPHQPGIGAQAMDFDGTSGLNRLFFHVSDHVDLDRSASFQMWVKVDALTQNQVLIESGDQAAGLSLTLGDSDADGQHNDLRFRVLGSGGQQLAVTAPLDRFADVTSDFVQVTAVFNDDPLDRHVALYVNGALHGRVDGVAGPGGTLDWDDFDRAGLGAAAGSGVGGDGGAGDRPFLGNFAGQIASLNFRNTALAADEVRQSYNQALYPAWQGVASLSGDTEVAFDRPAVLARDAAEDNRLAVMLERRDLLDAPVAVDAIIAGPTTLDASNPGTPGDLLAGVTFASYLLQFDPPGSDGGAVESASGTIVFERDILAVLWDATTLAQADPTLGVIGDYGAEADRGLALTAGNSLTIDADLRTLSYQISLAGDQSAQWRIVTAAPLVGDFALWESSWGTSHAGDFDGSGTTDGFDFLAFQRQFRAPETATVSEAVQAPEPVTLVLLASAAWCSRLRRTSRARRRR